MPRSPGLQAQIVPKPEFRRKNHKLTVFLRGKKLTTERPRFRKTTHMGSQNDTATDSRPSDWHDGSASPHEGLDLVRLNAARARAADETAVAIARELNGPMTALLLYMGEIKHHSDQLVPVSGDRAYLQRVVENALAQTERVCGLVKQLAGLHKGSSPAPSAIEG